MPGGQNATAADYDSETIASSQYTGSLLTGLETQPTEHQAEFRFEAGNSTGQGVACIVGIRKKE